MLSGISLSEIIIYFLIYSLLGWLTEVIYAFYSHHYFVNRGFLYGPFCPIYGFGIVSIILLLTPFKNNIILLFLLGTIITSIIEYITGFILEKIFKSNWWDYSTNKFNIKGRICLSFSLIWGLASVLILRLVHPLISYIVLLIPSYLRSIFSLVIFLYFTVDLTLTVISLIHFDKLISELSRLKLELNDRIAILKISTSQLREINKEDLDEQIEFLKIKYDNIIKKFKSNHIRLLKSFPYATRSDDKHLISDLKSKLNFLRQKK